MPSKCRVAGCNRPIGRKSETGLCSRCYAFEHYWIGRTVGDRVKRIDQIEFWQKRASQLIAPRKRA